MTTAEEFWKEYVKKSEAYPEVIEFSIKELKNRHKNAIALLQKYPSLFEYIPILIAGDYYKNVWDSRFSSGYLAEIFDLDYEVIYCSSSTYYELKVEDKDRSFMKLYENTKELDDK